MVIFSGNKKVTGGCLRTTGQLKKNKKTKRTEALFFWEIQKQTGYDEEKNNPTFKNGEIKNVKFNRAEVGNILSVFESAMSGGPYTKWSSFHSTAQSKVGINFYYYHVANEDPKKNNIDMFRLEYIEGKNKYQLGISVGDMYVLKHECDALLADLTRIEAKEIEKERQDFIAKVKAEDGDNSPSNESEDSNSSDDDDNDVPF